jgi:hypothetical protein
MILNVRHGQNLHDIRRLQLGELQSRYTSGTRQSWRGRRNLLNRAAGSLQRADASVSPDRPSSSLIWPGSVLTCTTAGTRSQQFTETKPGLTVDSNYGHDVQVS